MQPHDSIAKRMPFSGTRHAPGLGATYVERGLADQTVEHLGRFGIISEVVPDGKFWRVRVYPIPPGARHA